MPKRSIEYCQKRKKPTKKATNSQLRETRVASLPKSSRRGRVGRASASRPGAVPAIWWLAEMAQPRRCRVGKGAEGAVPTRGGVAWARRCAALPTLQHAVAMED